MATRALIPTVVAGCSAWLLCACESGSAAAPPPSTAADALDANALVQRIVDGDTIDVTTERGAEERVRLIGIDTPEIAHPSSGDRPANAAECFGDAAKAYTASLLPIDTPLRLERDVVARDDYGRLLAYVYRATDGVFVNYELARHGFAQPLTIEPNSRFAGLIVDATNRAESDGAGLWTACRGR